ncbi:MAG TPA: SAM-dependent methyltransferase [Hyphomicrobiaceae bacterium]|jgi:SAM-dependent MidA family methyltransferase|nr:SAM-dependent methyltransferase [Hyphomicrobiaceae bacterium]
MPNADATDGDTPLLARLRARIAREGPIAVDQYMQACLEAYWQRGAAIGAERDFITAPEISQVFGELIGLWAAIVWQSLGQPATVRLVELGPGHGSLMRDALRAARLVPDFLRATSLHLVEVSGPLRQAQARTLASLDPAVTPQWHASLAEVPAGPAIMVGNEFLDALPIRQLIRDETGWRERVVALSDDGRLRFEDGAAVADADLPPAPPGSILELRAGEEALIAQLAARAEPLVALLIDYGPAEAGFGDTLQAVRRHAYTDVLKDPGAADLTAHVQFAGLARKARAAGLATDGPIPQAEFLGRLGIAERAAKLMAANPPRAGEIETGVQRLMAPAGMGGLFKVLALRTPALAPPPPFG